jgi:hypothetical protein
MEGNKIISKHYTMCSRWRANYHGCDYACQVCAKSFEIYQACETDDGRDACWEIAKKIASNLNPPIPIHDY